MLSLPKIYPLTNVDLSRMSHTDQVRALAAAGCRFVQIREKSASSRELFDAVAESVVVANAYGMKVIVNDRLDIAMAARAHGLHLGQDDLPPAAARRLLGDDAIIGFSTHSAAQAREAIRMPIDYVAIGPIYTTMTKPNPDPAVGLVGIRRTREAIGDFPLVAIGGITIASVGGVLEAGADSAAIVGDLFAAGMKLDERFRALEHAADVKH